MNLMICLTGEPEQLPFLPEIAALGAGVELGSYGLVGIQSDRDWETRFRLHQAVRTRFQGALALHGPFLGMEFAHRDILFRETVNRRLDMTYDIARELTASRLVLHCGYTPEIDLFKLQDSWLNRNVEFWQGEIHRWADAGVQVVLENDTQKSPDILVRLVNAVDHPFLGLCLDIGHQHVFSRLKATEWVRRMAPRLFHVHLHDNDRYDDRHWPLGHGTVNFEPFYAEITRRAPQATLSLEVEDTMDAKMGDLRRLAARFAP